jgi:hypothetical protein
MLKQEALELSKQIRKLTAKHITLSGICLNIGSGTHTHHSVTQNYIQKRVHAKLKTFKLKNVDIKTGLGVDIVCDFTKQSDLISLRALRPTLVISANFLEHIPNPVEGLINLCSLIDKDSFLIISGPVKYPFHADPIDNGFRPDRKQIEIALPKGYKIESFKVIRCGHLATQGMSLIEFLHFAVHRGIRFKNEAKLDFQNAHQGLKQDFQRVSAFICVVRAI